MSDILALNTDASNPVKAADDALPKATGRVLNPIGSRIGNVQYGQIGTDPQGNPVFAPYFISYHDPLSAAAALAARAAQTAAMQAVAVAIQGSGQATQSLNAWMSQAVSAILAGNAALASLVAQQQANGQTQALILASDLRQETLLAAIAANTGAIDADLRAAQIQAHADALAALAKAQATNDALAAAHADAQAQIAAASAAAAQAHLDAQATATALALVHSDDQAIQAALGTLDADEKAVLAALQSLLSATATENATLSAISVTDQAVLSTLKAILAGGTPFSASPAGNSTATLFTAGANGSVIVAMGATSTAITGTILLTVYYATGSGAATATAGTTVSAVELTVGANAPVMQNVAVPAGAVVRVAATLLGGTVFGAKKDL